MATIRFDGLGESTGVSTGESTKDVEIWLPHNETIELVALRADADVAPATPRNRPVWISHGSSISQGSNAAGPAGTWPAVAARHADVDLVNLGFSGAMMLDPFAARIIRDRPADLISLEIGINLVNSDAMRLRTFTPAVHGFLDTIRDGHPDTPIAVISPLHCLIHEHTPGPGTFDVDALRAGEIRFAATGDPADVAAGKLTLTVIRAQLREIVAGRADANLFHVDGQELYGEADHAEFPLPDALHPGPESHRVIGERFAATLAKLGSR
ncbi:SGNH/GDSL hydrolase family protein [Saccharomonospora sp. CUA-673]|uniref:SGNH/GDSL hydrolase family protein n=1 Tax=Saccharomonospora sp. CUA-673 TaxID=1904969 RepID=UPI000A8F01DE